MKIVCHHKGFTLVEILVASAIILSILSVIYGTYFAVLKSTEATKARMAMFQQGQKVLNQLTQQIRCSYSDKSDDLATPSGLVSTQAEEKPQNSSDYFVCRPDGQNGEILYLVTAKSFGLPQGLSEGLFEVIYRFDGIEDRLYLSQRRLTDIAKPSNQKRNWQLIAENIESIEFKFLDSGQWLNSWSFKDREKLPTAVQIDINLRNEIHQTYNFSTIVQVCCSEDYSLINQSDELAVAKKR